MTINPTKQRENIDFHEKGMTSNTFKTKREKKLCFNFKCTAREEGIMTCEYQKCKDRIVKQESPEECSQKDLYVINVGGIPPLNPDTKQDSLRPEPLLNKSSYHSKDGDDI